MMHSHVDRFVQLNRALGKKFAAQETSLRSFADFAADRSASHVTTTLILEWAGGASTPGAVQIRVDQARALAVFLHAEDAHHEIPPLNLLGRSRRRRPWPNAALREEPVRCVAAMAGRGVQCWQGARFTGVDGLQRFCDASEPTDGS